MSYLRYHHILLIGIIMEKCENVQEKKLKIFHDNMKPCHSNNVQSNWKCSPNY